MLTNNHLFSAFQAKGLIDQSMLDLLITKFPNLASLKSSLETQPWERESGLFQYSFVAYLDRTMTKWKSVFVIAYPTVHTWSSTCEDLRENQIQPLLQELQQIPMVFTEIKDKENEIIRFVREQQKLQEEIAN